MWSLERRPNALDFYIRRVFRLYPLALVAVLFAAVTHAPVCGTPEHYFHAAVFSTKALILNLLLVQDLIGAEPIIHGVTWSLPPELYMYILLPCLFFYARTVGKLWPILIMWLLTALVARRSFPIEIGNNFPMLIPNFISGVIAYVGFMRRRPTLPAWTLLPLLAGLFAAYMSLHRTPRRLVRVPGARAGAAEHPAVQVAGAEPLCSQDRDLLLRRLSLSSVRDRAGHVLAGCQAVRGAARSCAPVDGGCCRCGISPD